jgi:NADPH:quinone reductase-like Zn-dependent oxidoreductase
LGADIAIDYNAMDFVDVIRTATGGRGVDVVLDMVGGDYVERNLSVLGHGGRHVSIAAQKGAEARINIRDIMTKRLILTGSTLRGRDRAEKARLIAAVEEKIWPYVATKQIKPVISHRFSLKNAAEAHKVMESGAQMGKIVLEVS